MIDKQQLLHKIHKDKRTPNQVFESLRKKIIQNSNGEIKESEATEVTRNLVGFFESVLRIPEKDRLFELEKNIEGE